MRRIDASSIVITTNSSWERAVSDKPFRPIKLTKSGRISVKEINNKLISQIYADKFAKYHYGDLVEITGLNRRNELNGKIGWVFHNQETRDNQELYRIKVFTAAYDQRFTAQLCAGKAYGFKTNGPDIKNKFEDIKIRASYLKEISSPQKYVIKQAGEIIWYYFIGQHILDDVKSVLRNIPQSARDGKTFIHIIQENDAFEQQIGRLRALGGTIFKHLGENGIHFVLKKFQPDLPENLPIRNVSFDFKLESTLLLGAWGGFHNVM